MVSNHSIQNKLVFLHVSEKYSGENWHFLYANFCNEKKRFIYILKIFKSNSMLIFKLFTPKNVKIISPLHFFSCFKINKYFLLRKAKKLLYIPLQIFQKKKMYSFSSRLKMTGEDAERGEISFFFVVKSYILAKDV